MSTIYDYAYYIDGRYIAILSKGYNASYSDDTSLALYDVWMTPQNDDEEAIMLEWASKVSAPSAETDSINVNEYLALAIVDYVKYRLLLDKYGQTESRNDLMASQIFYGKFRQKIWQNQDNKIGSPRIAIPSGTGVLR